MTIYLRAVVNVCDKVHTEATQLIKGVDTELRSGKIDLKRWHLRLNLLFCVCSRFLELLNKLNERRDLRGNVEDYMECKHLPGYFDELKKSVSERIKTVGRLAGDQLDSIDVAIITADKTLVSKVNNSIHDGGFDFVLTDFIKIQESNFKLLKKNGEIQALKKNLQAQSSAALFFLEKSESDVRSNLMDHENDVRDALSVAFKSVM